MAPFAFTAVVCLLLLGCPATVFWLIVPVVVDAIDAHSCVRACSHVLEEGIEGIRPALADSNPTASIERVSVGFLVPAAVSHLDPNVVLRRAATSVLVIPLLAPAACNVPCLQMVRASDVLIPAVAAKTPPSASAFDRVDSQCDKLSETFSGEVFASGDSNASPHASATSSVPGLQVVSGDLYGGPALATAFPHRAVTIMHSSEANNREYSECMSGEIDKAGVIRDLDSSHSGLLHRLGVVRAVSAFARQGGPFAFWMVAPSTVEA